MNRHRDAPRSAVVVGGGLAGLSAAVTLVDAGVEVTLLEARPRFGGATWSFERKGLAFDNGQHVYLRCCTAYRRFLDRLGTSHLAPLQAGLELPVLAPGGADGPRRAVIRTSKLPAPLHLGPSLLRYAHLGLSARLGLGRAVLALLASSPGDPVLDEETFASFLARHGQGPEAVTKLFDLIALPTLNVHASEASAALAAKVFRTGLLDDSAAADIGWARVPLSRLHVDPAVELLERAGATVRSKARVERLEVSTDPAVAPTVVLDGSQLEADAVVLAVAHEAAAELLPMGGVVDPASLGALGTSPIIDIHLVYDRRVLDDEVIAAVDSPVQFVFDRTAAAGMDPAAGQCLAISVSGADGEHGERPESLIERFSTALGELVPAVRSATLLDAVVSREHAATFRARPGTAKLRPGPLTGFTGLFLAGSWTDTGWPATMEGAVRSGVAAASFALRSGAAHGGQAELREEVVV